ncbi:hypothetical protein ELI00_19915 [Rhizobium ruizarguesonis]|uniref:hypothetical protein n=1 Tax=Rhizobium ruizarguesonis TaxID=2081791 RepID=UPI00103045AA|nr:hypothetical protein [Rhizobium ruizarguesonis]NKJ76294.1 hypothetical protein [Rhizobium leguminosarum bv. viciae]NKQ70148.1 hypothetical protein [Rhizobium ruizarguesonis]NKQ76515.1 hypothetical protein [Rhizobium ruizarguesonis]TAU50068.1 hypothetical protein ELI42_19460 [Rhizobium ruizarguesonis]TAU65140.1 hypothetical protein ELI44_19480 [Rhizobium ruizarguesonis]
MTSGEADGPPEKQPGRLPKVLFPESASPEIAAPSRPPAEPRILFGSPQAPTLKGDTPRVLAAGEVRRRIPCSVAALLEIDANAAASLASMALRIVDGTNLDDHHFDDVVRFGASLQTQHGRLAESELALVDSEVLARGKRLSAELLQRLGDLDPDRVFAVRGGVLRAIKALAAPRDPAGLFSQLYPEVQALAKELDALAPEIVIIAKGLRAVGKGYATLDRNLAAHILAGRFLVHYVSGLQLSDHERQAHYASQAEAIETRTVSLAATKATIEVSTRTVAAVARHVDALGHAAEGLLQEELPAWHAAYSAALTAARTAQSPAQAGAGAPLRGIHARILGKLKSEG